MTSSTDHQRPAENPPTRPEDTRGAEPREDASKPDLPTEEAAKATHGGDEPRESASLGDSDSKDTAKATQGEKPGPSPKPARPEEGVKIDASVEAEMDAAMKAATSDDSARAPDKPVPTAEQPVHSDRPKSIRGPRVVQGGREYRHGNVVSIGSDDIFIEFGPKELGVVPKSQYDEKSMPEVGKEIEVAIDRFEADEQIYICARPGAVQKADWELLEPGQVVEAMVTGTNKGGLELEVAQHRAFMPASLVDIHRIEDLSPFVGEKLTCKVKRVDRAGRGNITLSRRDVLAEERKQRIEELKSKLKEGDVVKGVVKKIMQFGAFVDIGGVDGLVHISDLAHDRVRKVEDVLKEGQEVEVKVLKLDWEHDRHSLGLKQLQADPFIEATKEVQEGEIVSGRVTKLVDFGAFIEVGENIEGLAHISELAWQRVARSSDVLQPNQIVQVKVLKVDPDSRRISLSVKQATDRPQPSGGGRGRGKGRRVEDDRSPEEILKETRQLRRLREKAKSKGKGEAAGGLGGSGGYDLGEGLGELKLG